MFENLQYLFAIPVMLILLGFLFLRSRSMRRTRIQALTGSHDNPAAWSSLSPTRSRIKGLLITIGLTLTLIALARPQWGFDWRESSHKRHDLLFILDISRSMSVTDIHPNRLERAKLIIRQLADQVPEADIGLLVFAKTQFLQCPATRDRTAFFQTLSQQEPSLLRQGSRIGDALVAASEMIRKNRETKMLLVSDGEDFSTGLESTLRFLRTEGLVVHTLCMGTTKGGLIPADPGEESTSPYFRDREDKPVYSSANPSGMKNIAQFLNGEHWHMQSEGFNPEVMVPHLQATRSLDQEDIESMRIPIEVYQGPLLIAWIFLCVELAIGNRRIDPAQTEP